MTISQKFIAVLTFQELGAPVAMKIVHALMDFRLYIDAFFSKTHPTFQSSYFAHSSNSHSCTLF
jgi:hypothetical protein